MQAEAANKVPQNQIPTRQPLLVKASLRHHSPEQIYDYVSNYIGELGMKIKKRQVIIGFEDPTFYEKLLTEHRSTILHGKKLEFKPIPMGDEHQLASQQQEVIEPQKSTEGCLNAFSPINSIEGKINNSRFSMVKKIDALFLPTIQIARKRLEQLRLELRDEGVRKREQLSLEMAIDKRLTEIEQRYQNSIKLLQGSIQKFNTKPSDYIDLEPTFRFEEVWNFPELTINRLKFKSANYFQTKGSHCRRLCAINGEQFAVNVSNVIKTTATSSFIKIFDVNKSEVKNTIQCENLKMLSMVRIGNLIIFSNATQNTLKYFNVEDVNIESTQQLCGENSPTPSQIYEIRIGHRSAELNKVLLTCTDQTIRYVDITSLEVMPGINTFSFEESYRIVSEGSLCAEIIDQEQFMYAQNHVVRRHNMKKKKNDDIKVSDKAVKIKKFSNNLFCVANHKMVEIVDTRTNSVVQTFPPTKELKAIEILGEHTIMYGGYQEVGILDDRRNELIHWKAEGYHKGTVYDILKLKNRVVSCDSQGEVYSWEQAEVGAPLIARPTPNEASTVQVELGKR